MPSESNDRESWRMETRAQTVDPRDWVTLPPSVLLLVVPTVPSHVVGLIVRSALCLFRSLSSDLIVI